MTTTSTDPHSQAPAGTDRQESPAAETPAGTPAPEDRSASSASAFSQEVPLRILSDPSPDAQPLKLEDVLTGVPPASGASQAKSGSAPLEWPGGPTSGGSRPGGPAWPGSGGGGWQSGPWGMYAPEPKPWRKRHPVLFWVGLILVIVGCAGYFARWAKDDGPLSGPRIAVINVEGVILDSDAVVAWIEAVRQNPGIPGAVVRINSPGGAVGPSQEIYRAVKRLAAEKEVVASMGAVAASGGYYVALGSDEIYANPSTLTASIGVKLQVPNLEKLMGVIGVSEKTLTTGKLKDAGSTWREMSPEEEAYFKGLIGDMYEEFIETTAQARKMPLDSVRGLADGRAMTGRQALAAKLVDKIGDRQDALDRVKERCKLPATPRVKVVEGPKKPTSMLKELLGAVLSLGAEQKAALEQPQFFY